MRRITLAVVVLIASIALYFNFAAHRCGWYEGRLLPCIEKPIGADQFCAEHDKMQHEKIARLLSELRQR